MTLKGPQLVTALNKKHLVHLGNSIYSIEPPLAMTSLLADLTTAVKEAMTMVQDCPTCEGSCDPTKHLFREDEYSGSVSSPPFSRTLADLLGQRQTDNPIGASGSSFLSGGLPESFDEPADNEESRRDLLAIVAGRLGLPPTNGDQQRPGIPPPGEVQQQLPSGTPQPPAGAGGAAGGNTNTDASNIALVNILQSFQAHQESMARQNEALVQLLANRPGPSGQQPDTGTDPTAVPGRMALARVPNKVNAAYLGVQVPPLLYVDGDLESIDMSKIRNKLKSGENETRENVVYKKVGWPQQYLHPLYVVNAPVHSKLSPLQYLSGTVNKLLAELDTNLAGTVIENQLKFVANLANQAHVTDWEDILAISATFYKALERGAISWDDWGSIQVWWERSLDALKARSAARPAGQPNKKPRLDNVLEDDKQAPRQQKTSLMGLDIAWMRTNMLCMRFQTGNCKEVASHKTLHGDATLLHVCGICFKLGKPEDSSHCAKTCPHKSQVF